MPTQALVGFSTRNEAVLLDRTRHFVRSVTAHAGLPPETLGYNLLLPRDYNVDDPKHAISPQRCIQHWFECVQGAAYLDDAEFELAAERAIHRLGWLDPDFVDVPPVEVSDEQQERAALLQYFAGASFSDIGAALGFSAGKVEAMVQKAKRAEQRVQREGLWLLMAESMQQAHLPPSIIDELALWQPISKAELTKALLDGSLESEHGCRLTRHQVRDLRGWLGILGEPRPPAVTPQPTELTMDDVDRALERLHQTFRIKKDPAG